MYILLPILLAVASANLSPPSSVNVSDTPYGVLSLDDAYDVGCEMQKKRIECAIMIRAAMAED